MRFSRSQAEKINTLAKRLNVKPGDLVKAALEDCNETQLHDLDSEIQNLNREHSQLMSLHAPLSSKVASLTFKYYELYRTCGSYAIAILGLEAEKKTLCKVLGLKYDEEYIRKEEELFEKYHKR
ncbi:MAG: hypothetical protein QXV32_05545 [Conexivisphaerales archaeon]